MDISETKIYPMSDNLEYVAPDSMTIEYQEGNNWVPVINPAHTPQRPTGNMPNRIFFNKIRTQKIRINFRHGARQVAISEVEVYE
jgi:hypothetical protein